jgi:hypothetical protein
LTCVGFNPAKSIVQGHTFDLLSLSQVKGFPTMLYVQTQDAADKLYAYSGTRDINHLKNFARRDWENVVEGAKSSMPPPPESLPAWQRYILEPVQDYTAAIMTSFEGIWVSDARPTASSRLARPAPPLTSFPSSAIRLLAPEPDRCSALRPASRHFPHLAPPPRHRGSTATSCCVPSASASFAAATPASSPRPPSTPSSPCPLPPAPPPPPLPLPPQTPAHRPPPAAPRPSDAPAAALGRRCVPARPDLKMTLNNSEYSE